MNERSFIVNTYSCSPPLSSVVPHIRNGLEAPRAVGEARYPESLPGGSAQPADPTTPGRQIAVVVQDFVSTTAST